MPRYLLHPYHHMEDMEMVLDLPPVPAGNDGPDVELGVLQLEEGSLELEELRTKRRRRGYGD